MINAFLLHGAITESVGRGRFNTIEPYNFIGDIDVTPGIFCEASQVVALEAYGVQELYTRTDEMISEAAASGVGENKIAIMVENVFSKIIDAVKKVWNKIVETIRGLIAKLKAFALRITGQTGKWINAMRPKIEEAQKRQRASSAKAEMHEWNSEVLKELLGVTKADQTVSNNLKTSLAQMNSWIDSLIAMGNADTSKTNGSQSIQHFRRKDGDNYDDAETTAQYTVRGDGSELTDEEKRGNDKVLDEIRKGTESMTKKLDYDRKEFIKNIAKSMGVSGSDVDSLVSNAKAKAYGTSKVVKYGGNVNQMMKTIESTNDDISNLTEAYNSVLDLIQLELDEINKVEDKMDQVNTDNLLGPVVTEMKSNVSAAFSVITKCRQDASALFNKLKSVATQAVKDRSAEYMRVLTKFANTKDFSD